MVDCNQSHESGPGPVKHYCYGTGYTRVIILLNETNPSQLNATFTHQTFKEEGKWEAFKGSFDPQNPANASVLKLLESRTPQPPSELGQDATDIPIGRFATALVVWTNQSSPTSTVDRNVVLDFVEDPTRVEALLNYVDFIFQQVLHRTFSNLCVDSLGLAQSVFTVFKRHIIKYDVAALINLKRGSLCFLNDRCGLR